jgi:hypothetical protein
MTKAQAATFISAMKAGHFRAACAVVSPAFWRPIQYSRTNGSGFGELVHADSCEGNLRGAAKVMAVGEGVAEFDALVPKMHVATGVRVTYGSLTVAIWESGAWHLARPPWSLGAAFQRGS